MVVHVTKEDDFTQDPVQVGGAEDGLSGEIDGREKTAARLRILWEQRQLILRLAGAGLGISLLIAFLIPKRYQSTTRLMPPDQASSSMAMLAVAASGQAGSSLGSVASDLLGMKSSGALFIGILQSRTVQDDLINKFGLRNVYGDREFEDARTDLSDFTNISEDRKSGIITVQVTDKVPQRAAAMAEEYVESLNRVVTEVNTSSAHRERMFLEERLAQVKGDLESAEKGFSQFASKNTAIDIQEQGKAMIEAAGTLEGELIAAETERQGLKQIYSDDNVRVRAAQARVEELDRQLQRIGGKPDPASGAGSPNGKPESPAKSMYPSIRELPLLGVNYADLYRATKVQEAIFETLTREYELAKVQEAKEIPSVKMIDPPDVPERKSYPPRLQIVFVGTALATVIGAMWVFATALWEKTDPQDPQKLLALEVVRAAKQQFTWAPGSVLGMRSASRRIRTLLHRGELGGVK